MCCFFLNQYSVHTKIQLLEIPSPKLLSQRVKEKKVHYVFIKIVKFNIICIFCFIVTEKMFSYICDILIKQHCQQLQHIEVWHKYHQNDGHFILQAAEQKR